MPAAGSPGDEIASFEASHFDPDEIAGKLMWPALNEFYDGDWRGEAGPGDGLKLTKRVVCDGVLTIVTLEAECLLEESETDSSIDHESPPSNTVSLEIARTETEFIRDLIFNAIPEDKYDSTMDGVDEDSLEARRFTSYYFVDEEGELIDSGVSTSNILVDANDKLKWMLLLADGGQEDYGDGGDTVDQVSAVELAETIKFREHDLEEIASGLFVLTGSRRYEPTIEEIRQHSKKED